MIENGSDDTTYHQCGIGVYCKNPESIQMKDDVSKGHMLTKAGP